MSRPIQRIAARAGAWCLLWTAATACAQPFVAGLLPDRRPEAAPRVTAAEPEAQLKQRRLQGVSQPWPGNVERIAEQGRWYSPMFLAGMTGPYDLRGWHRQDR